MSKKDLDIGVDKKIEEMVNIKNEGKKKGK